MVKLPSPDRLETIRILHIDDEPDLLQITKLYLIEENPAFVIESLSTPNNAMERLEEPFDCVISDYKMLGMDGLELCRRIKEKHDIPFIIYTDRGSEEVASIAFEAGADDYIRKEIEPSHFQVLARRIEEAVRKHRVERELRRSESRYRKLVELSPYALLTFDFKGFVTSVNRTLLDLTGFSEDELVGKHFTKLGYLRARDIPRYVKIFGSFLKGELPPPIEFPYLTKGGEPKWAEAHIGFLEDEENRHTGILSVVRDIAERKRMEEELIDASKMIAAGSIASMLGHDLRGPLQTIKNALYLMEKTPETADKSREAISNAVDHALEMLDELRSSTRDTPPQLVETDLENLFSQVVEDVSIPPQVTLAIDVGEGLDMALLDPAKMRRVLGNLLRNAVEAMPEGGELTVSGEIEGGDVVISVRDTGKGIPVEQMPDLFKPFVTTKSKGMGLGLPYCKRAVEAHGGSISVKSTVDVGSTFIVRLPLDPKT